MIGFTADAYGMYEQTEILYGILSVIHKFLFEKDLPAMPPFRKRYPTQHRMATGEPSDFNEEEDANKKFDREMETELKEALALRKQKEDGQHQRS